MFNSTSQNQTTLLQQAQTLLKTNQINLAQQKYQTILLQNNLSLTARIAYMKLLIRQHKFKQARQINKQNRSLFPSSIDFLRYEGILDGKEGKLKSAQQQFKNILKINQKDVQTLNQYAMLLRKLGRYLQSQTCLKKCIQIQPSNAQALISLTKLLKSQNKFDQALNYCMKCRQQMPDNLHVLQLLGNLYTKIKRYEQAQAIFKQVISLNPKDYMSYSKLISLLIQLKRFKEAQSISQSAIKLFQNNQYFPGNIGVLYIIQRNYQQAQKSLKLSLGILQNPIFQLDLCYLLFLKRRFCQSKDHLKISCKLVQINNINQLRKKYNIRGLKSKLMKSICNALNMLAKVEQINIPQNELKKELNQVLQQVLQLSLWMTKKTQFLDLPIFNQRIARAQRFYHSQLQNTKSPQTTNISFQSFLNTITQKRCAQYARNLCWMLCSSVQSYRNLGLGLTTPAASINSKVGKIINLISKVFSLFKNIPYAGKLCGIISDVGQVITRMDKDQVIRKINAVLSSLYDPLKVIEQVHQSVEFLINDKQFNKLVSCPQQGTIIQKANQYISKFKGKGMQLITSIENVKQQLAQTHCVMIMTGLLQFQNGIKNPLLKSSKKLMIGIVKKQIILVPDIQISPKQVQNIKQGKKKNNCKCLIL